MSEEVIQAENNQPTEEELRRKRYEQRVANLKPFRKDEDLTPEERERQNALRSLAGKKRSENIRKNKSMKEDALRLLNTLIDRQDAVRLIGEGAKYIPEDELTFQNILLMSAYKIATEDGNAKLFEFLRDTAGYKPKDEVSVEADIMTDSDRALIDKMSRRLTLKSDERIG